MPAKLCGRLCVSWQPLLTASALVTISAVDDSQLRAHQESTLAPLFNAWFPNLLMFLLVVEKGLDKFTFTTYNGFTYRNAAWELTVGGASHGIVGPVFLLLPLGLLALRSAAGRWLWIAGSLLALPWLTNAGTRFLMPSLPFFALALVLALPRPAAWVLLLAQAVLCWPAVLGHYERPGLWRLHGFPWRAALRLDSERDYLRGAISDYNVAEMINSQTKPDSKILGLTSLADAYIDREIYQHWQSELATRLREQILEAAYTATLPLYEWSAEWPPRSLRAVRFRNQNASGYEWEIHEVSIFSNGDHLRPGADWQTSGWPNLFETPFALDGIEITRWRSWEPARPGMLFQIDFDTPQSVNGVAITGHWEIPGVEVFGMDAGGKWRLLSDRLARARPLPKLENVRRAAMRQDDEGRHRLHRDAGQREDHGRRVARQGSTGSRSGVRHHRSRKIRCDAFVQGGRGLTRPCIGSVSASALSEIRRDLRRGRIAVHILQLVRIGLQIEQLPVIAFAVIFDQFVTIGANTAMWADAVRGEELETGVAHLLLRLTAQKPGVFEISIVGGATPILRWIAFEDRAEAPALHSLRDRDAGVIEHRWSEVDILHHVIDYFSLRLETRVAHKQRYPERGLIHKAFVVPAVLAQEKAVVRAV